MAVGAEVPRGLFQVALAMRRIWPACLAYATVQKQMVSWAATYHCNFQSQSLFALPATHFAEQFLVGRVQATAVGTDLTSSACAFVHAACPLVRILCV